MPVILAVLLTSLAPMSPARPQELAEPNTQENDTDLQQIDGPAAWKKAAEEYRSREHDLPPALKARYIVVNLYEGLSATLYEKKDFAAIEAELEKRLSGVSDPWKARNYQRTIDTVGSLKYDYKPEDMRAVAEEWTTKHPDSHFAWLIRGSLASSYAWYWRGNGYARTITDEGGANFQKYMLEAYQHLNRARVLAPRDPEVSQKLLEVTADAGLPDELFTLYFNRAIAICPSYFATYRSKLNHLYPKWGGSWPQVDSFVDECDRKSVELQNPMLRWIRINAYNEMAYTRPGFKDIRKSPEYKAANLAADRAVFEAWPDEIEARANYCDQLYNQGKYAEALEQFKWIGDRWYHPSYWNSVSAYNACRAYTLYKCADAVKDRDERITQLRQAIDLAPKKGVYYFRLAFEYRQAKDFKETEKIYLKGMDAEPTDVRNWIALVGLYDQLGRYEDELGLIEASRDQKFNAKERAKLDEMYQAASARLKK